MTYIVIIMIVVILANIYIESDFFQLKCIVSGVDGNKYCVRERRRLNEAADLLADVNVKMKSIVSFMYKTYPEKKMSSDYTKDLIHKRLMRHYLPVNILRIVKIKGKNWHFAYIVVKTGPSL